MPDLIIITLHPTEPVTADAFRTALTGLTVTAHDLTFDNSTIGVKLGSASGLAEPFLPPPLGTEPNNAIDITQTQIIQHFTDKTVGPVLTRTMESAATAVIVATAPPGHHEYPNAKSYDLRLELKRGTTQITNRTIDFNITVTTVAAPLPNLQQAYLDLAPSAYAAIPANAGTRRIDLPKDGTAPDFTQLVTAIDEVLAKDPADGHPLNDRGPLTPTQAAQVAAELVWDRAVYPPPEPPRRLGEMYTKPDTGPLDSGADNDRKKFEGEQAGYHATHSAEAGRLASFVFAASAAIQAERLSAGQTVVKAGPSGEDLIGAPLVAFPFPIITGSGAPKDTAVLLIPDGVAKTVVDRFIVPAGYFYAVAGALPASIGVGNRYDMARFAAEVKTLTEIRAAVDSGSITGAEKPITKPAAAATVSPAQAARRLRALGGVARSLPEVPLETAVAPLVDHWLGYDGTTATINADFWSAEVAAQKAAYLQLLLRVITRNWAPLLDPAGPIKSAPLQVTNVAQLVAVTDQQWRDAFLTAPDPVKLLPPFTQPGTPAQRVQAFISNLHKYFTVPPGAADTTVSKPSGPPALPRSISEVFARFAGAYATHGGGVFAFGAPRDPAASAAAIADTFTGDPVAQAWLTETLDIIDTLVELAAVAPAELRFSVMEALYARGFTSKATVTALSAAAFQQALIGTVAYDLAADIQEAAGGADPTYPSEPEDFVPVNPDGSLTECIPPVHLSPFGPVNYLHELLQLSPESTCATPDPGEATPTVAEALEERRGDLGELEVTLANADIPLPVLDLVNESLEKLAATVASGGGTTYDEVYNTAGEQLAGHDLRTHEQPKGHDPATLFAAIPEHSTPAAVAVPDAETAAYDALRGDFTAPVLPYDQPLDITRSYLHQMRTSRYSAMRHFRRQITEFVLAPDVQPSGFADHLWRYPVRFDIAREYLGISNFEYEQLYRHDIPDTPGDGQQALYQLYGFVKPKLAGRNWPDVVLWVPEFLRRTGLTYCELLELQQSGFVRFGCEGRGGEGEEYGGFPPCEPCCLDDLRIEFDDPRYRRSAKQALRKLIVFIRLYRTLQALPGRRITFEILAELCVSLRLFDGETINPDFLRQLAAVLMLLSDLRLQLGQTVPLLALWGDPAKPAWRKAVDRLLNAIEDYAEARHGCRHRGPEFLKVIADNLDPLSILAGFAPNEPSDNWFALPTHTLRFVEVLGKIYASDFTVGEILFLFTTRDHLNGEDPFPLPDRNESLDDPLALPEWDDDSCADEHSLWALRRKLLAVEIDDDDARHWSWARISTTLRAEFGYRPPGAEDPLLDLGRHFFPAELRRSGTTVGPLEQRYAVHLAAADTSPHMWIAPPDGPFGYDESTEQLWTRLPLTDAAVIDRLRVLRPLRPVEQDAVRDLYFAPRAALTPFAALLGNFDRAVDRLIGEADEKARFAFFREQFALFHRRCRIITEHLTAHVRAVTGADSAPDSGVAWRILRELLADENLARTPWEDDSGQPPEVTWSPRPSGGAFAALLGLTGTGLLGEFRTGEDDLVWREQRGPMDAFGQVRNERNAPVPTIVPTLDLELTAHQLRFVGVRNGFALRDTTGEPLGGAEPFTVRWSGVLLIEAGGEYRFHAGLPDPDANAEHTRWRVLLARGQREWTLLNHRWRRGEEAPPRHSEPLSLRRGAYRIVVEFDQDVPAFQRPEDICPVHTGFRVEYAGPDTATEAVVIPFDRLFRDTKDRTLRSGIAQFEPTEDEDAVPVVGNQAANYLEQRYSSTLRDIRRTYQRAFKTVLFAQRFGLSATPVAGYQQSELGFLLEHPEAFEGTSYYRAPESDSFVAHRAWFDPDLLPVGDPYPPAELVSVHGVVDQRSAPSPKRQAALFDWWERVFDYGWLRARTRRSIERPPWVLFAEVLQRQPDDPAELLRHLGVDLQHAPLVLHYFDPNSTPPIYFAGAVPNSADLVDERWPVRVWRAEQWLEDLRRHFLLAQLEDARPALWASDDPSRDIDAPPWISPPQSGNANLTRFIQDGYFENGDPRRYLDVQQLNDGLRERARTALLAYLCGMNRVSVPNGYARMPRELSDLLLLDVECGLAQRATRIADAVTAAQGFIQRARVGQEPGFPLVPAFIELWSCRFGEFDLWATAKRRDIYRENWIEWDDIETARRSEAFRFLEDRLRTASLTIPVPGGQDWWPPSAGARPPDHRSLLPLQAAEPSGIALLPAPPEGLGLQGMPEFAARPSWLAPISYLTAEPSNGGENGGHDGDGGHDGNGGNGNGGHDVNGGNGGRVGNGGRDGNGGGHDDGGGDAPNGGRDVPVPHGGGDVPVPDGGRDIPVEPPAPFEGLPLWLQAAVGLGKTFLRVAAAGLPPASTQFTPRHDSSEACCLECGRTHPPLIDEYYFWVADSEFFDETDVPQRADAGSISDGNPGLTAEQTSDWHRPEALPGLLNWESRPMVHLYWSRYRHGEFESPRRSTEGLAVTGTPARLVLGGRSGDSLRFEVSDGSGNIGVIPVGYGNYKDAPPAGFRYDLATDSAVVLPLVAAPAGTPSKFFGLPAYPFFVFVSPGAQLFPPAISSVAHTVAGALRARCRFDAALRWYELAYQPLQRDNTWSRCSSADAENRGYRWEDTTCCPTTAGYDDMARDRALLLAYLETLLQWGEGLLCRNSEETSRQAAILFGSIGTVLGDRPRTVLAADHSGEPVQVADFHPRPAPLNPRLLALYDRSADRLSLVRHALNGKRLRGATPTDGSTYWDRRELVDGWRESPAACDPDCAGDAECLCCTGPYRFSYLIGKAVELAAEVRGLGAALLAAYEKGDAEALAALRATHERQLLDLALRSRQLQWREADWQVQALGKTKEGALSRLRYYQDLILHPRRDGETAYEALTNVSMTSRAAGTISETVAQGIGLIPDMWIGVAGLGPLQANQLPLGMKLANASFATAARIMYAIAEINNTNAGLNLTQAGWQRRLEEWEHQVEVIGIEIDQIERQTLAAERRRDTALRDLNNHQQQREHAEEVHNFLRDKFTHPQLYLHLQQETSALHRQLYGLATRAARRAQRAFNNERGHQAHSFLPEEQWDTLHDGLMAGERLHLALRRMEHAYLDANCREYELTKHLSLRLDFPAQFLQLQATGGTEIEIPEWMFDLDHPGHYLRRIKNATLSIPCVVGPYTGVHCKLTLLSNTTRVAPWLAEPPAPCCPSGECRCGLGYQPIPEDPRFVRSYTATEAIATSHGQNDSGLFELSFRDERYLPFEFAGAVSRWRIELPPENNRFDFDTLGDVVLHLNYTAREGGEVLGRAANDCAQAHLPGNGLRLFDIRHDFPDDWYRLVGRVPDQHHHRHLPLRLGREHFGFLPDRQRPQITRMELFIEVDDPHGRGDLAVRYVTEHDRDHGPGHECHCGGHDIECVASAEWPNLYHGVLDLRLPALRRSGERDLGEFQFPAGNIDTERVFLLCHYTTLERPGRG